MLYQLELLACVPLLRLLVWSMTPTERTVFFELEFIRRVLLVLGRRIVTTLTSTTCEGDYVSH